jgi:predicted kinase
VAQRLGEVSIDHLADRLMESILLIGIQGSGKTTLYRERFFDTHVRISLDVLRTRNREKAFLETCLRVGQRFVIDNTNATAAERASYIGPSREAHFKVVGYFFEPDPSAAYARNVQRPPRARVPPAGVFGTLKRLERPTLAEGFDSLYRVWIAEPERFEVEPWSRRRSLSPSGS